MTFTSLLFLSLMGGCDSENELTNLNDIDDEDLAPILVVSPERVDFTDLRVGEISSQTIEIMNEGTRALELQSLTLNADAGFSLRSELSFPLLLEPDAQVTVEVDFSALTVDHEGVLVLISDDVGAPRSTVELTGGGLVPRLVVDPDPYDFGRVEPDCTIETEITLANMGKDTLEVTSLVQLGTAFDLLDPPELPIYLEPYDAGGTEADNEDAVYPLSVSFTPTEITAYEGELWVSSNAQSPRAIQSGEGSYANGYSDEWEQPVSGKADILFWVDQSCSMEDDKDILATNFIGFLETLDNIESDYLIMVVINDSGCHNLEYMTPEQTPSEREAVFRQAITGTAGLFAEAGLSISKAALREKNAGPGGCNSEFRRENATVSTILVSDEPDQSYLAGPSVTWSSVVSDLLTAAPSTYISAVAGPVPDGCPTASPGTGYAEAAAATGGIFVNICSRDWGEKMAQLAEQAATAKLADTFRILDGVEPNSIEVYVNDVLVETGWRFDEELNAVVFDADSIPGEGSNIRIEYETAQSCEN